MIARNAEQLQEEQYSERLIAMEAMGYQERIAKLQLANDLALAKLKVKTAEKRKMWERVALAAIKGPTLLVLAIMIPVLVLAKREVPEQILNFLSL